MSNLYCIKTKKIYNRVNLVIKIADNNLQRCFTKEKEGVRIWN